MRIVKPIFFLLILIILSALNVQAQECGGAFNIVKVLDSKSESIRGAVFEIVAQFPKDEYKDLGYGKVIKLSVEDAESVISRDLPMRFTEDIRCGNPLKQYVGVTKVKNKHHPYPNAKDLGFCTSEVIFAPLLLKVSAPGYETDYYVGNYLGGCGNTYEFIVTKKKSKSRRTKKSI